MNKISPKPKVGDFIKILPGGRTTTSSVYSGKILTVTKIREIKKNKFTWYILTDIKDGLELSVWPDEFIIISTVTKEQKQHLLDLIKSI